MSFLGVLVACGLDAVDKPRPPDTEDIEAGFESPTGSFKGATPQDVEDFLARASRRFEVFCGFNPVLDRECLADTTCRRCLAVDALTDVVRKVSASLGNGDGDAGSASGRSISGVDGVLYVDSICKGWGDVAAPDPEHGMVHLTAGFTGRGLDPVVWGNYEQCEQTLAGVDVILDGDFTIRFARGAVPFRSIGSIPADVSFKGKVGTRGGDRKVNANLAVRGRLDGTGPILLYTDNAGAGSFVFSADGTGVTIRGASGEVRCDVDVQAGCYVEDGS